MLPVLKPSPDEVILDPGHRLTQGLVGWWLFNEGGGTIIHDYSGRGNDGELKNMDPDTDWVIGGNPRISGYVPDFDGDDDYCEITTGIPFFDGANFSASWWFHIRAVETTNPIMLFALVSRGNSELKRAIHISATVDFKFDNFPPSGGILTITEPPRNEWHHCVITDSQSIARQVFIDGVLEGSDAGEIYTGGALDAIDIMSWVDANRNIDGMFDNLRIYNRILNDNEVTELYDVNPFAGIWQPRRRYFVPAVAGGTILPQIISAYYRTNV